MMYSIFTNNLVIGFSLNLMASGFTALATIIGGFISGGTGIIVFLFRDKVQRKKEKEEWYSNLITFSGQLCDAAERYEREYCGRYVRDITGRMHTKFQEHIESAPEMASDETLDLLKEASALCHDISNTRPHVYEGGEKDGETHIQSRHEDKLIELIEVCEDLNKQCVSEEDEISYF